MSSQNQCIEVLSRFFNAMWVLIKITGMCSSLFASLLWILLVLPVPNIRLPLQFLVMNPIFLCGLLFVIWLILRYRQLFIILLHCSEYQIRFVSSWRSQIMLLLTKPTNIIAIVIFLLVIIYGYLLIIFLWFLGLVGSLEVILLVHIT